jgi:hypothetical protein
MRRFASQREARSPRSAEALLAGPLTRRPTSCIQKVPAGSMGPKVETAREFVVMAALVRHIRSGLQRVGFEGGSLTQFPHGLARH